MKSSGISKIAFILLACVAVVIAAATFVEDAEGTAFVTTHVYGAWWFRLVWMALALVGIWQMVRMRLWHRFSVCLLHVSFLFILVGALTTALTSRQGMIHLRQHEPVRVYMSNEKAVETLPFTLELDTFYIDYYPGTEAHSDYTSVVNVGQGSEVISMNHILKRDGWRLYQASFDEDLQGSWLTATYDPWGIGITYVGYLLLAISAVLLLIDRRETFMGLLKHPALRRGLVCAIILLGCCDVFALPVFKRSQADSLRRTQVIYGDRVVPLNTVAIDFVQKMYGKKSFCDITPEQVLLSWQKNPQEWRDVPILKVKEAVCERLGVDEPYLSVNDLFDEDGNYRLEALYQHEFGTHSKLAKAIRETDEKVGIVLMLERGTLFQPLPQDGSVQPLSEAKVNAELLYNAIPFTKILFMVCLTAGFILFFIVLWQLMHSAAGWHRAVSLAALGLMLLVMLFHAFGYGLRWYISGTVPLTNGYETMQFVALATMLIALLLARFNGQWSMFNGQCSMVNVQWSMLSLSGGFLISGFTLLVSHLGQMNPRITSLMPVLQSPWLSSHVSFIMISYALFAFITLNAIVAFVLMARGNRAASLETVTVLSRIMLYPAVLLLAVGIFLGAVWANVSWGSYWSWDPKEVWALVTMIVYGIAFHRQSLPWLRRPLWFHLYMFFAFLTVLMTYFGVNYLLGGMHSYAG